MALQLKEGVMEIVLRDREGSLLPDEGKAFYIVEESTNQKLQYSNNKEYKASDLPTNDPTYGNVRQKAQDLFNYIIDDIKIDEGI